MGRAARRLPGGGGQQALEKAGPVGTRGKRGAVHPHTPSPLAGCCLGSSNRLGRGSWCMASLAAAGAPHPLTCFCKHNRKQDAVGRHPVLGHYLPKVHVQVQHKAEGGCRQVHHGGGQSRTGFWAADGCSCVTCGAPSLLSVHGTRWHARRWMQEGLESGSRQKACLQQANDRIPFENAWFSRAQFRQDQQQLTAGGTHT